MYNIGDYLDNKFQNHGACKVCQKQIIWNRQKLSAHKRSGNCEGQPLSEREFFKGMQQTSVSAIYVLPNAAATRRPSPGKQFTLVSDFFKL